MKYIPLFILSIQLGFISLNAQTHSSNEKYTFVPYYLIDSAGKIPAGNLETINIERIYMNDSTFKETGYYQDTLNSITFQIRGEIWYFKQKDKYYKFFDGGEKVNSKFYIADIPCSISWEKACSWDNTETYILNLTPLKNYVINHIPSYFFNPEFGIVATIGHGELYIRKDLIGNSAIHICK